MKEIATTNKTVGRARNDDIIQSLDLPNQEYIRAALAQRVCNMTPKSCSDDIIDCIYAAHNNSGQVVDDDTATIQANETYTALIELFPDVTIEEIRQAIRNGVYDQYGKYFGLNPKTYVQFVRSYLISESRKAAKIEYEAAKAKVQEPSPPLTNEEIEAWINKDFATYKLNPDLIGFAPIKYFYLIKDKTIKHVSGERWKMWLQRSKEEMYWRRTESAKKKGDKGLLNELAKITTDLEETGKLPINEHKKIIFNARRLRYLALFEYAVKNNLTTIY